MRWAGLRAGVKAKLRVFNSAVDAMDKKERDKKLGKITYSTTDAAGLINEKLAEGYKLCEIEDNWKLKDGRTYYLISFYKPKKS